MEAPGTEKERLEIEEALQAIDPRLRVVWNPQAFLACPGSYDDNGNQIPVRYEPRWQVVMEVEGEDTVIYTLAWDGEQRKAFRPLGWWVVDFMKQCDRANKERAEEWSKRIEEEERLREWEREQKELANQEFLDRQSFKFGGRKWIGGRGAIITCQK